MCPWRYSGRGSGEARTDDDNGRWHSNLDDDFVAIDVQRIHSQRLVRWRRQNLPGPDVELSAVAATGDYRSLQRPLLDK